MICHQSFNNLQDLSLKARVPLSLQSKVSIRKAKRSRAAHLAMSYAAVQASVMTSQRPLRCPSAAAPTHACENKSYAIAPLVWLEPSAALGALAWISSRGKTYRSTADGTHARESARWGEWADGPGELGHASRSVQKKEMNIHNVIGESAPESETYSS